MKKIIYIFLIIITVFALNFQIVEANTVENIKKAGTKIELHFFYSISCSHCKVEKSFLQELESNNSNLLIKYYEISQNKENFMVMEEMANNLGLNVSMVPFLIIGNESVEGYVEGNTKETIINKINANLGEGQKIVNYNISVPLFGDINMSKLSLPIITVIIGVLDRI